LPLQQRQKGAIFSDAVEFVIHIDPLSGMTTAVIIILKFITKYAYFSCHNNKGQL